MGKGVTSRKFTALGGEIRTWFYTEPLNVYQWTVGTNKPVMFSPLLTKKYFLQGQKVGKASKSETWKCCNTFLEVGKCFLYTRWYMYIVTENFVKYLKIPYLWIFRVVSGFLSSRFHPKSRGLWNTQNLITHTQNWPTNIPSSRRSIRNSRWNAPVAGLFWQPWILVKRILSLKNLVLKAPPTWNLSFFWAGYEHFLEPFILSMDEYFLFISIFSWSRNL